MTTTNEFVLSAITNTNTSLADHWAGLLKQRAGLSDAPLGSCVPDVTPADLEQQLRDADWTEYQHPAVQGPVRAFKTTDIGGLFGLVRLADLEGSTEVELVDGHQTGCVECVVPGRREQPVDFVVLLIGEEDGQSVVFTFFPGDPVRPSSVLVEGLSQRTITAARAIEMGFEWAKVK